MKHVLLLGVTIAFTAALPPNVLAEPKPLVKSDRIVFLGDSITAQGAGPNGFVTLVRKKLAAEGVTVIGAGIGGHKVPDLEKRLDRDVISKQPTIVVIYIGINDVWHSTRNNGTPKDKFDSGLRSLIERVNAAGARAILCTPSLIGEKHDGSNPLDKMLDEYCAVSRTVAKDTKTQLIDLRLAFLKHVKAFNKDNATKGVLTTDGVHLNEPGNVFVANEMLAGLGVKMNSGKVLRHVVLFKFKDDVEQDQIQKVVDEFGKLKDRIDVIVDYEHGTDVSVESLADGFTHCFFVTFQDEKGRDTYLPHPEHKKFVDLVKPSLDKVLVIDYWVQK
ncbi:MAG: Dabb family protein [Planctomycetota bacterium]|nr:Dabb family protein [Planctomycetota bacterium]